MTIWDSLQKSLNSAKIYSNEKLEPLNRAVIGFADIIDDTVDYGKSVPSKITGVITGGTTSIVGGANRVLGTLEIVALAYMAFLFFRRK